MKNNSDQLKIKLRKKAREEGEPQTNFGIWVVYYFIERFEHNVLALVYIGAGFLVFILGFRGIGGDAPDFLLDPSTNKVYSWLIYISVILETLMIGLLGLTMMFKPEEDQNIFNKNNRYDGALDGESLHEETIKRITEETIEQINEKVHNLLIEPQIKEKKFLYDETIKQTSEKLYSLVNELYNQDELKTIDQIINDISNIIKKLPNEFLTKDNQLYNSTISQITEEIRKLANDIQIEIKKETYDKVTNEAKQLETKLNRMIGKSASIGRENEIREQIQNLFSKLFHLD